MSADKDQLDKIHDMLAENEAVAALQSIVEGRLDAPLSHVISTSVAVTATSAFRAMVVLNYVGRMLRDAYGGEAYAQGLKQAQTDLYVQGIRDTAHEYEGVLDAFARDAEQASVMADKVEGRVKLVIEGLVQRERRVAMACGFAGAVGALIPVLAAIALMWANGSVTFQ